MMEHRKSFYMYVKLLFKKIIEFHQGVRAPLHLIFHMALHSIDINKRDHKQHLDVSLAYINKHQAAVCALVYLPQRDSANQIQSSP